MTAASESVWAIDIGNSSIKALHLSTERGRLEVVGFDNIRHGKILTGSGTTETEKEELIALSLRRFVSKHDLSMDDVAISVPSQNSFARFVTLPPVEQKRIAEIVKFEAVQQIPFDINEVQWDWQIMSEAGGTELKVGIFAIKNDVANTALEHFNREDIPVSYVQMAPMALYNYALYDRPDLVNSNSRATVVLNVGAEVSDLVVCTKSSVWQRCILIGGDNFTRAIADAFRLDFEKAEKLKRTAPVSKYARQIFQAMRPVFTELASEVQRSLGFYKSANPGTKVTKVITLGGGTKLRGLLKYLQQTLQLPVERPDTFKRLAIGPGVPAAKFGENVCDFGIVYGLGVQGLGLGGIESNLLPRSMARSMAWAGKGRWFMGAACMLLAVSVMALGRTLYDRMRYSGKERARQRISSVLTDARQADRNLEDAKRKVDEYRLAIDKQFEPFKYREVILLVHETVLSALPNAKNNPRQAQLYAAFERGDVEGVLAVERKQRMQLFVTSMSVRFASDLSLAQLDGAGTVRTSRSTTSSARPAAVRSSQAEYRRMTEARGRPVYGQSRAPVTPGVPGVGQEAPEPPKAGFVVTIEGYSPYENIDALIDPIGAEDQPKERWGFVTRLLHLDEIVHGNSPLALYGKTNPDHFRPATGAVDLLDQMMPAGIGEQSVRYTTARITVSGSDPGTEPILVDPMTKELISRAAVLDNNGSPRLIGGEPVYEVNDHWFTLSFKLAWRDAPVPKAAGPGVGLAGGGYQSELTGGSPVRREPSRQPASASKKKGKSTVDIEF